MPKFITLTHLDYSSLEPDDNPYYLNPEAIVWMQRVPQNPNRKIGEGELLPDRTVIAVRGYTLNVKETPDEIIAKIHHQ